MDTAKPTLLLLLLVVLTAGSRVLDGVEASVTRVVILGRVTGAPPEMVVEGWIIGTLAVVGWLGVGLFVGVAVTATVTLGVGAAVVGA